MTTCMTPKLKGMAQTAGGRVPRTLYKCADVSPSEQGEPTPASPLHAHKKLAGAVDPGMTRIKGVG